MIKQKISLDEIRSRKGWYLSVRYYNYDKQTEEFFGPYDNQEQVRAAADERKAELKDNGAGLVITNFRWVSQGAN